MSSLLAESGGILFGVTAAAYAGSLANYVATLVTPKAVVGRIATVLRLFGLVFHTVYLGVRYYHAGVVEVAEREVMGEVLVGYERFWVFISHPPYTNLYESLMFITWCVMIAYAVIDYKWKLKPLGVVALGITLAGIAEAYIVVEKGVKPLVPALQSWWLLVHVGMIFVAYSLFMLAAGTSLMYLLKAGTKTAKLGWAHFSSMAIIVLLAGGFKALLGHAAFEVTPLAQHNGKWLAAHWMPDGAEKAIRYYFEVPGVGPLALLSIALMLAAAWFWRQDEKNNVAGTKGLGFKVSVAAFGTLTLALGWLVYTLVSSPAFTPPDILGGAFVSSTQPPFRLSVGSNYNLGLLALAWAATGCFLGMSLVRPRIESMLPDMRKLDDISYKTIIVAFPLITIGIVMGAMWAFDAWGRYWGWDPKETWALITWALYGIYLHVRIVYGPGKKAAGLAVFGFAVVVFTYMGVNLGLTGDGLHVYGSG